MAKRFTLLNLPGDGKNLHVEHDQSALLKEIHSEISKLAANPLGGRTPPRNKPSTIRRKGSETPLRDTGKLLDDIVVEMDATSLRVSVQGYYFYLKKPYRLLFRTGDIMKAISKVAHRYLERMIKVV